jgi:subtilisin family serine protease
MTLGRYFILEQDPEIAGEQRRTFGGLQSRSLRPFGARSPSTGPAAGSTIAGVKVAAAEMTAAEAITERKREGVRMVGAAMPIRLIRPQGEAVPFTPAAGAAPPAAWGIAATGADRSPRDGRGVTIAVLDTGINPGHPAFAAVKTRMTVKDFTDEAGTGEDLAGHGSHCAGTIFGADVNGTRIGIARNPEKVLIGKVLPDDRSGDSCMLFDALNWASREGADIVSMSLGFDFPGMVDYLVEVEDMPRPMAVSNALIAFSQNLRAFDTLMATFKAGEPWGRNMLVIGAAGNESGRAEAKPFRISASLPSAAGGVIPVAAYGRAGDGYEIALFSNINPQVAAPGVEIVSADLGGGLTEMSGTSQACPHVAGLAALWWHKLGEQASPERVREEMLHAATTAKLPADCDEVERGRGRVLAPSE